MAHIPDLLSNGLSCSFEFGPPRDEAGEATLTNTLDELAQRKPTYVSVTYGAGGSTRDRTHDLVVELDNERGLTAMAHLTCAAHKRSDLEALIERYNVAGIDNILALGGDPPRDYNGPPGELQYASDLVALIRAMGDFSIGVAAHPEPHPKSPSLQADRDHTAEKLAAADFAVTQFFFEARHYFDLVDGLKARGVDKPVIAGIMPATSISAITRMAQLQGSDFPAWLADKLYAVEDQGPAAMRAVGVEEATKLCQELMAEGVPGFQFFTLNFARATREICDNLGI